MSERKARAPVMAAKGSADASSKMSDAPAWASGVLDLPVVAKRLQATSELILNCLERDNLSEPMRSIPHLRRVVRGQARVAINMHRASIYLCAANENDGIRRRDYIFAAFPLNRCLLDIVFNVAFLLEKPTLRLSKFLKSGWRDLLATCMRHQNAFGKSREFRALIELQLRALKQMESIAGISAEEKEDPKLVGHWPHPGIMIREGGVSNELEKYFRWLDGWFYGELSSASHSSFSGLVQHVAFLEALDAANPEVADRQKSVVAFQAIGLLLAVFSEIEMALCLGAAGSLMQLWTEAAKQGEIRTLYERRYEKGLSKGLAVHISRGRD